MCFITVSDGSGEVEAVVFPDLFAVRGSRLHEDSILLINGKISLKDDSVTVICGSIFAENELSRMTENMKLCIKADSADVPIETVSALCGRYSGSTEICFYLTDVRKVIKPKSGLSVAVNQESYREFSEVF